MADFIHMGTKCISRSFSIQGAQGDESNISGALITKSIGSGKTKVLDHKQMKILDYMNRNLQTVGVETSIKDATLLIYKNKIGSIHVIDNKNIGRHHQRWYPPLCQEKKKQAYFFCLDLCETAPLVTIIEKAGFKVLNFID